MKRLVIVGGGADSLTVIETAERCGYTVVGVVDPNPDCIAVRAGYPLVSAPDDPLALGFHSGRYTDIPADYPAFDWPVLIDPAATVSPKAEIGRGCVICPGAIVQPHAVLDEFAMLHCGAIVCHHARIGACDFIAPGATICGQTILGDRCWIGAGATVIDRLSIGADCFVGAGVVVTSNANRYERLTAVRACADECAPSPSLPSHL